MRFHKSQEIAEIVLFETCRHNTETDVKRSLPYGTAPGIEGIELAGTYTTYKQLSSVKRGLDRFRNRPYSF